MEAAMERYEAIEQLAQRLCDRMEYLRPSKDDLRWAALSDDDREFYRRCIRYLVTHTDLFSAIFGVTVA